MYYLDVKKQTNGRNGLQSYKISIYSENNYFGDFK